jgi:hypothetical protein
MNQERLRSIRVKRAVARKGKTLSMVFSQKLGDGTSADCIGKFQANFSLWLDVGQHLIPDSRNTCGMASVAA